MTAENAEFKMTYLDLQAYASVTKHMGGFEATKKSNWVVPPVRCLATWGMGYSYRFPLFGVSFTANEIALLVWCKGIAKGEVCGIIEL